VDSGLQAGPAWANSAWLIWLGLVRLGFRREADQVRDGWVRAVAREGLREFYDPLNGEGHGARKFGWTCLILDMLAGDEEGASRSYLPRTAPENGEPAPTDAANRSASRGSPEETDRDAPPPGM
jgi:glycogen debranching enzyme